MSEGQVTAVALVLGGLAAWTLFLRYRGERRLREARARLLAMREQRP